MAVCVTGATGFLATHIIRKLLEGGDTTVHGTVRSLGSNPELLAELRRFPNAATHLRLFEADLLQPDDGRFAAALAGCAALLHTATPVIVPGAGQMTDQENEDSYCIPAVEGTAALLDATAAAGCSVVVLTASTACFLGHPRFDECKEAAVMSGSGSTDSDEAHMRKNKQWYRLAKTLQERLAREKCPELGIELATIHPSLIVGPYFGDATTRLSAGHAAVLGVLNGPNDAVANGHTGVVHVEDVAAAHISAARLLLSAPNGAALPGPRRYLLNQPELWHLDKFTEFVAGLSPLGAAVAPPADAAAAAVAAAGFRVVPPTADCGPAERELGIVLKAAEASLQETVDSLVEKGLVQGPAAPKL
eukprot:SAG22_NODE_82_length_21749_cov_10.719769_2_plen_362_part_00